MRRVRALPLSTAVTALLLMGVPAQAEHGERPHENLTALGEVGPTVPVDSFAAFADPFYTDLAFWGDLAFQGTWNGGFRIVDIGDPSAPVELSEVDCGTNQGDTGVWDDLVFRSVNSRQLADDPADTCDNDGTYDGVGYFEGIQVFQVDDPSAASAEDLITAVGTYCGSHTHTVVPDLDENRVLIYSSNSGQGPEYEPQPVWGQRCGTGEMNVMSIVEVPLDAPETASVIGEIDLGAAEDCHDMGVLLNGSTQLALCAGEVAALFDISDPADPVLMRTFGDLADLGIIETFTGWHSAAFSWDGSVAILGWEPGGGLAGECATTDPAAEKTVFFFEVATGELLGMWTLPRAQEEDENCTIHNYSVVPTPARDILVMGNYQAGTWVVDFTNPESPQTLAWSDPEARDAVVSGAWGSYWYRGLIYEGHIEHGLNVFAYDGMIPAVRGQDHLNPQTQLGPVPPFGNRPAAPGQSGSAPGRT